MNKLIWKSEKEQLEEFEKRKKESSGRSGDGYVCCAEGKFIYKKIAYLIKVLRYFTFSEGFKPLGTQRISDKHAVVEYPEETRKVVEIVNEISSDGSEFLYHDTLHSWNDKQTTEEQIEATHRMAKDDIDDICNGKFVKKINEKIKSLEKIKNKLKTLNNR